MTALVDDTFRVFAAARQGDLGRVRGLLLTIPEDQLLALTATVSRLRGAVAVEVMARGAQIARETPTGGPGG